MSVAKKNSTSTKLKSEFHEKAGAYLKDARLKSGVTLKEIAKAGKCTPQFIVSIDAGKAFPPPQLMKAMIKAYQMDGEEFLSFIMSLQLKYYKNLYF